MRTPLGLFLLTLATALSAQAPGGKGFVVGAALLGFASSALFTSLLHLPRDLFVLVHSIAVAVFLAAWLRAMGIDLGVQVRRRWVGGLVVGLLVGAVLTRMVLNQPASPRSEGLALLWALYWPGVTYGVVDAFLLSVFPVLAVYGSRPAEELAGPGGRWRWGLAALLVSLAITAAYHLGFDEFRGRALIAPLAGNGLVTASYLATGSPIAAVLSHVVMHVAAVLQGMENTPVLPPHYP
ncbi:MAG: hypothetical protein ACRENB_12565 [Gemmatimonadales bacterium]